MCTIFPESETVPSQMVLPCQPPCQLLLVSFPESAQSSGFAERPRMRCPDPTFLSFFFPAIFVSLPLSSPLELRCKLALSTAVLRFLVLHPSQTNERGHSLGNPVKYTC
jgi:hypothetical protein